VWQTGQRTYSYVTHEPQHVPSDKNLDDSYNDEEAFEIEKPQEISEDEESIEEQNFAS
jgi:hypothetical protein